MAGETRRDEAEEPACGATYVILAVHSFGDPSCGQSLTTVCRAFFLKVERSDLKPGIWNGGRQEDGSGDGAILL